MKRWNGTAVLAAALLMTGSGTGWAANEETRTPTQTKTQTKETQAGRTKVGPGTRAGAEAGASTHHDAINAGELTWKDAPPSLPAGAEVAILEGDPEKKGPFTLRIRLPAGYRVEPHTHPVDERVTVLSGTLHAATGRTFDKTKARAMTEGGFVFVPARTPSYVWTTEETVFQLHGTGPWGVDYVDPADDPRQRVRGEEPEE